MTWFPCASFWPPQTRDELVTGCSWSVQVKRKKASDGDAGDSWAQKGGSLVFSVLTLVSLWRTSAGRRQPTELFQLYHMRMSALEAKENSQHKVHLGFQGRLFPPLASWFGLWKPTQFLYNFFRLCLLVFYWLVHNFSGCLLLQWLGIVTHLPLLWYH